MRSEESMDAFKNELLKQDWDFLNKENDTDKAYDEFLRVFTILYDKNCPIKQYCRKQKYKDDQWMSKGLQNACKKKNTPYR